MYYNRGRTNSNFWYDMSDRYASTDHGLYFYKTAYGQNQQTFNQYAQLSYRLIKGLRLIGAISHESDDRQLLNLVGTTYKGARPQRRLSLAQVALWQTSSLAGWGWNIR